MSQPNNMQEAQQAQTIARIKAQAENGMLNAHAAEDAVFDLLEIVDHREQKIAKQAQTIATNAAYAIELQGKIAEQAKKIDELKTYSDEKLIAKEFWARGYEMACKENARKLPKSFRDRLTYEWDAEYEDDFTDGGNFNPACYEWDV